jgi:hypothetical protein
LRNVRREITRGNEEGTTTWTIAIATADGIPSQRNRDGSHVMNGRNPRQCLRNHVETIRESPIAMSLTNASPRMNAVNECGRGRRKMRSVGKRNSRKRRIRGCGKKTSG